MTRESEKLSTLIHKAIADHELTMSEYESILAMAHADGQIDRAERQLLSELNSLIADGTVKRVKR